GLDLGHAEEAASDFEHILRWFPTDDYDPYEVNFRLAYACRLLGRVDRFNEAVTELTRLSAKTKPRVGLDPELLRRVTPIVPKGAAFTPQKRHPRHRSFSDYDLFEPLATPLSSEAHRWRVPLAMAPQANSDDEASRGEALPFHLPWVVGNDLYFKHYNRIWCRSIVTGELRWVYDLGPLERMVRRLPVARYGREFATLSYAEQDILVDEDLVFANVQVYGRRESLVALDRVTGELRWAAGPIRPMDEDDLVTCYDATPALGRQAVYAPWSRDRGEGGDLLYTSVGLTAFDKETGRVLWTKEICRLTPTVTTQRKWGVRVWSATPVVREGVIYHVTNAGVVTALDATSGLVRWITRYPHAWSKANDIDAHDEVPFGSSGSSSFAQQEGPRYQNQTPIVSGDLLYVTPFDSDHFLALDRASGRVEWSMVAQGPLEGIAPTGELVFAGRNISFYGPKMRYDFYDPDTRQLNWSFYPTYRSTWGAYRHARGQYLKMSIISHPTMTRDGRMYFSTLATPYTSSNTIEAHRWNTVYAEWCLSVTERRLIDYRVYYSPRYRDQVEGTLKGKIRDQTDFASHLPDVPPVDVHAPVPYDPVRRLPFRHHGVPFELVTSGEAMWMNFDPDASGLARAVGKGETPAELFTQAELLLGRGDEVAGIAALERCKSLLRPEETAFIRECDRELFGLYRRRAWKARLAGDVDRFHRRALQMAQTAITVRQDIRSLLALAESFEARGEVDRAAR
ncbi:MAG TPA: PQQ-binding-like beta-propeller repeat protein, partial [Planctomycetota bacterium]|nr:PQQ-binding-like beta-propeller repeat protein [Planctomycetota bacterium]